MSLRRSLIAILILACLPAVAAVVSTSDGLSLSLGAQGQVAGVTASGRQLTVAKDGGFYAIDMAARAMPTRAGLTPAEPVVAETKPSAPAWLRESLKAEKGVVTQAGTLGNLGLKLETSCASAGGYLSFSGKLTDLTGRDRAVEVGYEIPLEARGWTWSDDIVRSRTVTAEETYRSTWDCAAGAGYCAIYPFSSLATGKTGISLGVPLAQGPRVYSVEYDGARQCLRIRFHFGLSRAAKKLPGQAWFSFLLYQHDGQWGMRSAAERYYGLFPGDFEKRVPREGYLGYADLETTDGTKGPREFYGVPAFGDFGSGFNWIWHNEAAGAEVSPTLKESLEGSLLRWRAEQPLARPYEWCISTDGAGFTGRQVDLWAEHVERSDVPLTYDSETKKPTIADVAWEFDSQVLAPLAKRYKVLLYRRLGSAPEAGGGLGTPPYAGGASIPFVDVGLIECAYGKWGWTENIEAYVRTSGYRKVFRYWFYPPEGEKRAQAIREMFQRCLPYAIYPHLLPDAAKYRDLYLRYVPLVERLSAAGWEPVTLAKTKDPDVHVERYGRVADSNLAFAARNLGTEAKRVRLVLDAGLGLGLEADKLEVRDLLTGEPVMALAEGKGQSGLEAPPTTSVALPLILAPGESVALSVLPREGQLRSDLLNAAECVRQASELCSTDEMSYQASRPGELLAGDTPSCVRADNVLSDGWSSYQGLIWQAGEPLTIKVDLNSPHRLRWLRLHYGYTDAYEIPEVMVEGQDREGNWGALGTVAGGTTAPLLALKAQGEYQLLRLTWPALSKMLWLKEIEVEGEDAALLRAAERFAALAELGPGRDLGLAGQLTIALRVRRMLGHDKTLQERALSYLSDFTSTATGLFVSLYIPPDAPATGPVQATLVVVNRGTNPLHEGSIKLKLPPGWSAAPTKFEVELPAGQTRRLPVTVVRAAEGHLTLLTTGSMGANAIFMSRWL